MTSARRHNPLPLLPVLAWGGTIIGTALLAYGGYRAVRKGSDAIAEGGAEVVREAGTALVDMAKTGGVILAVVYGYRMLAREGLIPLPRSWRAPGRDDLKFGSGEAIGTRLRLGSGR